jgi:polyferredoxin
MFSTLTHLKCADACDARKLPPSVRFGAAGPWTYRSFQTWGKAEFSTFRANSAAQVISRFANCLSQSGVELPHLAIKQNIAECSGALVQIERRPDLHIVAQVMVARGFEFIPDRYDFEAVYRHSR